MGKIRILDESVSNIIAAGEVVENPASMVKELLENSLDANSSYIKIEVKDSGRYVKIVDNGIGMTQEDLLLSVERHATSKIWTKEDLYNLNTYGFRGEALSSVAAVSKMTLSSRTEKDELGTTINILAGKITNLKEIQKNIGTEIEIRELFYNTPARLKFLRKSSTEYSNIKDIVVREAIANPNVSIILIIEGKEVLRTSGRGIDNAILDIFGRNILKNLKKFSYGYIGNISIVRSSKDSIYVFVNGRPVKSKIVEEAVIEGYYTKLMKGKYPFAIIDLKIDPKDIDVNVHPSKKIVKFSNEEKIYYDIVQSINENLSGDYDFVTYEQKIEYVPEKKSNFLDFKEFMEVSESKIDVDKKIFSPKENLEKEFKSPKIELPLEIESEKKYCDQKKTLTENKEYFKLEEELVKNKYKVLGQFSNSFILVEEENELVIYDQHIVHERILYENLKKEYGVKETNSQQLLVPIKIETSIKEKEIILENMDYLKKFGFEVEEFSPEEVIIRSVPSIEFKDSIKNIFYEIVEGLKKIGNRDKNKIIENLIISMSCRGAIKANEVLSLEEMKILIDDLHKINEYTCPHGRPIRLKLTMDDLEKGFKRK